MPSSGSIVDCFAPSSAYHEPRLSTIITSCKKFISKMGWQLRLPKNMIGNTTFYANTTEERALTTAEAIIAPDSQIAWALRGGYGANIIMPRLASLLPSNGIPEKVFIGFSDITAIHMLLINKYNWSTILWDTLGIVGMGVTSPECIKIFSCLISGETEYVHYELTPLNDIAKQSERISGKSFGGNMTLVRTSIGTFWGQIPKDSIIFLEDVDEKAYKIHRSLHQLLQADMFKDAKAIILGELICYDCPNKPAEEESIKAMINIFANEVDIPCFRIEKVGHLPYSRPIPLNTKTIISKTDDGLHVIEIASGMRYS